MPYGKRAHDFRCQEYDRSRCFYRHYAYPVSLVDIKSTAFHKDKVVKFFTQDETLETDKQHIQLEWTIDAALS